MKDGLMVIALNQKAGLVAASSSIFTWFASMWGWLDINIVKLSSVAAFVLTVVMIVAHICTTIRQNREHRSVMRERELKIEVLQRQLNEDADH